MRTALTALGLLLVFAPLPATAQEWRAKSDAEVMNYRLSMEKLRKLLDAQHVYNALNAKNPQLFERIDSESRAMAKKNGAPLTVAQRLSVLDRYPELQRALAGIGWNTRDWLLTAEAMGAAYTAMEVKKGTLSPETAPPPTAASEANVALLQKNEAEWKKILQELDRLADELLAQ